MIEKRTAIDQIEITDNGTVMVRFGLMLVEDGNVVHRQWHRTAIPPGISVNDQLAVVDENLTQMNAAAIDREKIPLLKSIVELVHTPAVVSAYEALTTKETT